MKANHLSSIKQLAERIQDLLAEASPENFGDVVAQCFSFLHTGPSSPITPSAEEFAELERALNNLYLVASRVDIGWKLFANVDATKEPLNDGQIVQLVSVSGALREMAYCFSSLSVAALQTPYGSTAIRFFINSICSQATAWFLLDEKANQNKGYERPGSVIKVLAPLGLAYLLDPVYRVLESPLGEINLGDAILQIRNQSVVHTDFRPESIKRLYTHSALHRLENKLLWNSLLNELGNETLLLQLKLMAIVNNSGKDLKQTAQAYLRGMLGEDFDYENFEF